MVFHALGSERTSSELAEIAGLSRPATSQHLAGLTQVGLLRVRADGRNRRYRSEQAALDSIREELAVFWAPRLDRLRVMAETEARRRA